MASKRKARELIVKEAVQLTPNMRRVTLHGSDLDSFPANAVGHYFKLVFTGDEPEKPILRTYTVAQHRPNQLEIDVDFMLHTHPDGSSSGVAAAWAQTAKAGDTMSIFGPGGASFVNTDADWFLLAADMTGLPAMLANLNLLPAEARGYVIVEILSDEDKQTLVVPKNMEIVWVVNPNPGSEESLLFLDIKKLDWLPGQVAVWAACEFKTLKKLRTYFKIDRRVEKSHLYVSSYWKKGLQEEEHKIAKREDST